MFDLICSTPELEKEINAPEKYYPVEVCQELPYFLNALRKYGDVSKTDFLDIATRRIPGNTLDLYYRTNFERKEVLLIKVKVKSADIFSHRFSLSDSWDDQDVIPSIPQCDNPEKLIKAIDLINSGIHDSYQLGYELGHRGEKRSIL